MAQLCKANHLPHFPPTFYFYLKLQKYLKLNLILHCKLYSILPNSAIWPK
jgi:hypothetical protein